MGSGPLLGREPPLASGRTYLSADRGGGVWGERLEPVIGAQDHVRKS